MAIEILMEHLMNNKIKCNINVGPTLLNKVQVSFYDLSSMTLDFTTKCGHRVTLNIPNFKDIKFDAINSTANTADEMLSCISKLQDSGKYSAHLRSTDNNILISFIEIPA